MHESICAPFFATKQAALEYLYNVFLDYVIQRHQAVLVRLKLHGHGWLRVLLSARRLLAYARMRGVRTASMLRRIVLYDRSWRRLPVSLRAAPWMREKEIEFEQEVYTYIINRLLEEMRMIRCSRPAQPSSPSTS